MIKKSDYEKIESILANAGASLAVEGLNVKDEETKTVKEYLKGQYTEREVLDIIKKS